MKSRTLVVSFSLGLLAVVAVAGANVALMRKLPTKPAQHEKSLRLDPPGTVNGAENPTKIPDEVAYSLAFRLIEKHRFDNKDKRLQGYFKLIGLDDSDKKSLLLAADEFQERVGRLDKQAAEIKNKTWPRPDSSVMAQLTELENQKKAIVIAITSRMLSRMSTNGSLRLQQHVNNHVKSKIKMFPPTPLPSLDHSNH